MDDPFTLVSPSPDQQHIARLALGGEIRFGPAYYTLALDEYPFAERIFGSAHCWSPSSALLAVQEWLTLDYAEGPITALVLIDVHGRHEITVARATKRFLIPEAFDGAVLVYRDERAGQSSVKQLDLQLLDGLAWQPLP